MVAPDPRSGWEWQQYRAKWAARIAEAGSWPCRRCRGPIRAGEPFDLGHRLDHALGGDGVEASPEHPACNRSAGGKLGARIRAERSESSQAL